MATADLIVKIITDTSKMKGLDDASGKTSKFSAGLQKASAGAAVALAAVGAAAISAGKAAAEDQASQAALAQTMKQNTGATSSQIAATEDWISAQMRATGIADDELRPALGNLVRATGDVQKSQEALKVAMDVSAATGKPLATVSQALAKGFGGSTTSLGKLVPGLSEAALKSENMTRIMGELKAKTEGAAVAAGDTAAGQMKKFQNSLDEAQESLGAALLPVLEKVAPKLTQLGQWVEEHPAAFQVLAGAIIAVASAILILNVAVTVYTAIQTLAAAATWATLWPILLVIAAVVALAVAFFFLWKKSETFRKVVTFIWESIKRGAKICASLIKRVFSGTWEAVKKGAKALWDFIKKVWNGIKSSVKAVTDFTKTAWRKVSDAIKTIYNGIKTTAGRVWDWIKNKTSGLVDFIKQRFENLKNNVRSVFDAVKNIVASVIDKIRDLIGWIKNIQVPDSLEAAFNRIKDVVGDVIGFVQDLINAIRNIPTPSINWPSPPKWLDKVMPGMAAPAAPAVARYGAPAVPGARTTRTGGAGGITINVTGAVDPENVARQIQRILAGHNRRVGLRAS